MQQHFQRINNMVDAERKEFLPNKFNFDFLNGRKQTKETVPTTPTLRFAQSIDAIDEAEVKNKKITYSLEGSSLTRLTNEANLHEKVHNYIQATKPKVIQIDSQNKETQKSNDEQKPKEQRIRYYTVFDSNDQAMRCRRCGLYGHYQRNCTESIKESCFYCMGKHHFIDCSQLTCHRCNEEGHRAKDCTHKHGKCYKCDKFGHREVNCGTLVLYEDLQNGNFDTHDLQRMRCLHCHKKGHINCAKTNQRDNLYQVYNSQPENGLKGHMRSKQKRPLLQRMSQPEPRQPLFSKRPPIWQRIQMSDPRQHSFSRDSGRRGQYERKQRQFSRPGRFADASFESSPKKGQRERSRYDSRLDTHRSRSPQSKGKNSVGKKSKPIIILQ